MEQVIKKRVKTKISHAGEKDGDTIMMMGYKVVLDYGNKAECNQPKDIRSKYDGTESIQLTHLSKKYSLNIFSIPDTVLGLRDTTVIKTHMVSAT